MKAAIALLVIAPRLLTAQLTPPPTYRDVSYGPDSVQRIDVYKGQPGQPLVVFFHGTGGDKAQDKLQSRLSQTLARGWWFASANYREDADTTSSARGSLDSVLYEDGKSVMRLLRQKAQGGGWTFDSLRIAAWGASRGGAIALWLGTTCRSSKAFGRGGSRECPRAVVNQAGPSDLLNLDTQLAARLCTTRHNYPTDTARLIQGSSLYHVSPKSRPTTTLQGLLDCTIPPDQQRALDSAYTVAGVWTRVRYYPFADHVDPVFGSDSVIFGILQDLVTMFREP